MRPFKTNGRPIPRYRGKVGQTVHIPSEKNAGWRTCETLGEAAVALALEFEPDVVTYETQTPVDYSVRGKTQRGYTDLKVHRQGQQPHHYEVRLDASLDSETAMEKLEAKQRALEYISEKLTVVPRSEVIETARYSNQMFLYRFRKTAAADEAMSYLLGLVDEHFPETMTIQAVMDRLNSVSIPVCTLYHAMATGALQFHWDVPIEESARVWRMPA
jgi:hypothetical protein